MYNIIVPRENRKEEIAMTDYEKLKAILWDAHPTTYQDQWIDKKEHDTPAPTYLALELESRLMLFTQEGKYKCTTSRY
jgi:hypothetical protein